MQTTSPVRLSKRKVREERLLELGALADFANLGDTPEEWEEFRLKSPEFFPRYLTDWLYDSAKLWKRLSNLPEARPDDYLLLLREFRKDPDTPIPPDAWPEIARNIRSEVRDLRPAVILYRTFLRVVWKRKDRHARCLRTLLGIENAWPIEEFEEETNEKFCWELGLPGPPKTDEELTGEEKVIAQFDQHVKDDVIMHVEIFGERRETFGGLPVGRLAVDGDGIISWEFGCQFQRAVYDLMQDRWRAMVCPNCGKYFVADKTAQKYCSPECYLEKKGMQALDYYNRKVKGAKQKAKALRAKSQRRKS